MTFSQKVTEFDRLREDALRRIWFVGDVHGQIKYLRWSLLAQDVQPRWIVFVGDIDIAHQPFHDFLAPLRREVDSIRFAFVHGNHDADSYAHWDNLHADAQAVPIHAKVVDMDGVRVAGLGGHFVGKVWHPPSEPNYQEREEVMGVDALRVGQRPSPRYLSAIFPADITGMEKLRADILVTHEAPSCHHHGFEVLDALTRRMGAVRSFHGHHHDDHTAEYAQQYERLGFAAVALGLCAIKNGLGDEIFAGVPGW